MATRIRFAVVGLVHDHLWPVWNEGLLRQLVDLRDVEVVATADKNEELLRKAQTDYGIRSTYADYRDMLDREKVDAVLLALPNDEKADAVELISDKGLDILMDKPMAATLMQANRMVKAVARAHTKMMVNWPTAWMPALHLAKVLIENGEIGQVFEIKSRIANPGPEHHGCSKYFLEWLLDPSKNGGGALIDYCCYGVLFSRWFLGMPKKVFGSGGLYVKDNISAEDNAWVLMDYPHAHALAEGSWSQFGTDDAMRFAPPDNQKVIVHGSRGSLVVKWFDEGVSIVSERYSSSRFLVAPPLPKDGNSGPAYFLRAIRENSEIEGMVSVDICRDVQEVMEAAYSSMSKGAAVAVPMT
jgi:predicted dehydrogenase